MIWFLACVGGPAPTDSEPVVVDSELDCSAEDASASIFEIEGHPACGQATFETYCGGCHGDDARGRSGQTESGPDLSEHVPAHTDEELVYTILAGQGEMPASGLDNHQVAHILAWLRQEFGPYDGQGH